MNFNAKNIIKTLNKNFKGKDVNIIFSGSLETTIKLYDFRFYISRDTTIFSDKKGNELKIDNYWINNVIIKSNVIKFEFENEYSITVDC